ncbi:VanZ family protein [Paenibacillus albiflavus]|uniref:VanZ family protein n=1 Tax=Paenibacillus albiflavus TaxID=2545760 RepID=A0A4R4EK54_9BACL|nr:VanZ family protein [Paenibacillus albiflavus]TCZ80127.1 VanZ family protein [Paenibacillus albiflavus]
MTKLRENYLLRSVLSIAFISYLMLLVKLIMFKMGSFDFDYMFKSLAYNLNHLDRFTTYLDYRMNLIPFREISGNIRSIIEYQSMTGFLNFVGNIVAFIPLGFMLPILFGTNKAGFTRVLIISLALSAGFELLQLITSMGACDIDDVILNTSGGVIGYLLFLLGRSLVQLFNQPNVLHKDKMKMESARLSKN